MFDVLLSGNSERERMEEALDGRAFGMPMDAEEADYQLAISAKDDPAAFGELYERYHTRVYRYIYHRTGHASDAEDITALVFMKALEALPGYQPGRKGFAPWLFRIARNAVVDHYRRQRKQNPFEAMDHLANDDDPVGQVLGSERRAELKALVDCLSADQRDVILLRYVADLSYPEIASALNKNEPAVRMLLHRGLRKLKAVMDDE